MMQQFDDDSINVDLLPSQARVQIINANTTYCAYQRGGGKTQGVFGPRIQRLSEVMPRTQCLLATDTYERLEKIVVPNIIFFLESHLGLVENVDFIKFKRPPEHWQKPFIPLDKFDRVISFSSGFCLCLVSLRVEGSANGFNAQSALIDEAKFCDETDINTQVLPALRGLHDKFGHLAEYLSVWMCTDKFGPKIKWYLKKREKVDHKAVEVVYTLQMAIFALHEKLKTVTSSETEWRIKKQIIEYEKKANSIRKYMVYFSEMLPYENKPIVSNDFFRMQRRVCKSVMEFEIAILNHDPDKVENCFYPTFTQLNKYTLPDNSDYDATKPFIISFDYNYRIVPIPICQIDKLPNSVYTTVNIIDYVYELYPKGLEDAIATVCDRYKDHKKKVVHYVYDHTAIGRSALKTTYKESVVKSFKLHGWKVVEHHIGQAPDHDDKYPMLRKWYAHNGDMAVRVNTRCEKLINSIEQSPAIIVSGKTQKDKATEKDLNFPADESTHGSDALDTLLWGVFVCGVRPSSNDHAPMRMKR
jgi:hypothetical protein